MVISMNSNNNEEARAERNFSLIWEAECACGMTLIAPWINVIHGKLPCLMCGAMADARPAREAQNGNVNGSSPKAAESTQQPINSPQVKLYEVSVVANVQMTLIGCVSVYATDEDEAVERVQFQIDDDTLDDDLEMEDYDSGFTVRYGHLKYCSDIDFQTEGVEVVEHAVDPFDVLQHEVEYLESQVSWNTEALAKHKAFLESLLNDEGDDEQAVAA
jgi:hypothetical protein